MFNDHPDAGLCDTCWWRSEYERMSEALAEIADEAEAHPLYMAEASESELDDVGGDAAYVTTIAQMARAALTPRISRAKGAQRLERRLHAMAEDET